MLMSKSKERKMNQGSFAVGDRFASYKVLKEAVEAYAAANLFVANIKKEEKSNTGKSNKPGVRFLCHRHGAPRQRGRVAQSDRKIK